MKVTGSARLLSRIWWVTISAAVIAVLVLGKVLLVPLAFAILFAFLLAPLVERLERLHVGRLPAVLLVLLCFVALLGTAGWKFFTQMVEVTNDLPAYRDNITRKIETFHQPSNSAYGRAERELQRLSEQLGVADSSAALPAGAQGKAADKPLGATPDRPVQVREVGPAPGRIHQLGGVLAPLSTAFLSMVFTFFVLQQREDLRNRLIRLSGEHNLTWMTQAMADASRRISRYFSLQLLVNSVYGTAIFLALHFIGLPHAALFGALAGLARFVPYVGASIAALLPTLLSLAVFHGWSKSLLIAGIFLCMEIVTANFAEPRIYGRHTGLSSLAILLAAGFWTMIWGPVGLALSIPITVCLVVMGSHIPSLEFLSVLLGDKPRIPQWACFYQRLLAHDGREAAEILETAASETTLENAYGAVLVPALILCEEDRLHGSLEAATVRYIRRSARALIQDLGYRENSEAAQPRMAPDAPQQPLRLLCIPLHDETDEFAATMLAQCAQGKGITAHDQPVRHVEEVLRAVATHGPDVIFLCGLPPVGITRSQRLYRALRLRYPQLPILIGIWNLPGDPAATARSITGQAESVVSTTLQDALAQLRAATGETAPGAQQERGAAREPAQDATPGRSAA